MNGRECRARWRGGVASSRETYIQKPRDTHIYPVPPVPKNMKMFRMRRELSHHPCPAVASRFCEIGLNQARHLIFNSYSPPPSLYCLLMSLHSSSSAFTPRLKYSIIAFSGSLISILNMHPSICRRAGSPAQRHPGYRRATGPTRPRCTTTSVLITHGYG